MKKIFLPIIFFVLLALPKISNAAVIESVYFAEDPELNYPIVKAKNAEVSQKINDVIFSEVSRFVNSSMEEVTNGNFNSVSLGIYYSVPCNHENGILSIVLTEYVNYEGSAHPATYRRGLNFNSDSGVLLTAESLSEIGKEYRGESIYSPKNVMRKLKAHAKKEGIFLFPDVKSLEKVPEDFYFDEDLHVHFIFQQYDVAPYAAGIIEVDAG